MISRPEMGPGYPISGHDIMTFRTIYLYTIHVYDFHESIYLYIPVYGISRYITVYDSTLWFTSMTVYVVQVKYIQVHTMIPLHNSVYDCLSRVCRPIYQDVPVYSLTQ